MELTHFTLGNEDDSAKITRDEKRHFQSYQQNFPHQNRHPVAEFDLALLEYVLQMSNNRRL